MDSMVGKVLGWGEAFLGSKVVQTIAFAMLADRVLRAVGLGFFEFFLLLVAYVGISVKIDQIQAALSDTEGR